MALTAFSILVAIFSSKSYEPSSFAIVVLRGLPPQNLMSFLTVKEIARFKATRLSMKIMFSSVTDQIHRTTNQEITPRSLAQRELERLAGSHLVWSPPSESTSSSDSSQIFKKQSTLRRIRE